MMRVRGNILCIQVFKHSSNSFSISDNKKSVSQISLRNAHKAIFDFKVQKKRSSFGNAVDLFSFICFQAANLPTFDIVKFL